MKCKIDGLAESINETVVYNLIIIWNVKAVEIPISNLLV